MTRAPSAAFPRRGPRRPPPKPPPGIGCAGKARARTGTFNTGPCESHPLVASQRGSVPLSSAGLGGATIPGGRFRKGGEASLRVERTGSTPRVRPSGAALQLDPSHRSSQGFSDSPLEWSVPRGLGEERSTMEPTPKRATHARRYRSAPSARGARRLGLHRRRRGELAELRREERARERARRGHGQAGRAQGVSGILMALVKEVIRAPSGEEAALADLGHGLGAGDRAPKVFPEPGEALGPDLQGKRLGRRVGSALGPQAL